MNTMFLTPGIGYAGVAKMVTFIANELCKRGHCVTIVNLNLIAGETHQSIAQGVKLYDLKFHGRGMGRFKSVGEIVKIAKKEKADVIIGFTEIPNLMAKLAGMWLGVPSVMSERGDPVRTGVGKGLKNKIVLEIINRCSGGVFQTDGAKEFYGKGLQKRGVVIPNPIFIKGQIPQVQHSQREKSVVSVARLDNFQKRYDVMLEAFRIFSMSHPDYVLKLYGQGSDEALIRKWTEEAGLLDKVHFMGLTKQPMQDIARDGMFLITSDFEGISNSLLEAMAVGLPCVSTDHSPGGARLLITDRENGLLAPVENPQKLAEAMCAFAQDPQLAAKCGDNAKNVTVRFAPERIIDQWENYLNSLIRK